MLRFLNDLSKFTQTFSSFKTPDEPPSHTEKMNADKKEDKKTPQSPTAGIADEFIQNILDSYLQKH